MRSGMNRPMLSSIGRLMPFCSPESFNLPRSRPHFRLCILIADAGNLPRRLKEIDDRSNRGLSHSIIASLIAGRHAKLQSRRQIFRHRPVEVETCFQRPGLNVGNLSPVDPVQTVLDANEGVIWALVD